jgi:MYXO-CTERM domain-containing protein
MGCPAGQICQARNCRPDLCLGVACELGQYCSNGACLQSCTGLTCPQGQSCRTGQCQVDACWGVSCPSAAYCDPNTAVCKNRPCSGISCLAGTVCIEVSGKCETNPCEVVRCQAQEECIVQPDGHPECVLLNNPYVAVAHIKPGSRGLFGCSVGGDAGGPWTLALLLLGLVATRMRRRR